MTRLFTAKPFIIAEVGSNWQSLDQCLESIRVAKACGADAVKYQLFNSMDLYGFFSAEQFPPAGVMDPHWLPTLKAKADEVGLEFMCTAFSPNGVHDVDPYVSVHKVASSDAAWPQMLEAVARTGKPVLVSTGAKTDDELIKVRSILPGCVMMGCTAAYPADYTRPNAFPGLSDHTLGYTACIEAAVCGAIAIEKHFTAFPDLDTPDRGHSLDPTQFKRMVDIIRGRPVESEETAMFLRHNRRLIATRDVAAGETLTYGENYGAYRSLKDDTVGASPFDWQRVEGRVAKSGIARGKGIGLEDAE